MSIANISLPSLILGPLPVELVIGEDAELPFCSPAGRELAGAQGGASRPGLDSIGGKYLRIVRPLTLRSLRKATPQKPEKVFLHFGRMKEAIP